MLPGDGGNGGQPGLDGTVGSAFFGAGGGGAGGSLNPFGCESANGADSGCGGAAGAGGGLAYGAGGGQPGASNNLNGTNGANIVSSRTGAGGGGGGAPGGLGGRGGGAEGGPTGSSAGGTSLGGYGIHVVGANTVITNAGRIVPGTGSAQSVAILYADTAHNSVLRLQGGSDIQGTVDATRSTNNTLVLDGAAGVDPTTGASMAFDVSKLGAAGGVGANKDVYQGFSAFEKASEGAWQLVHAPTQARTAWRITGGTLAITSGDSLGSTLDAVTLDGGTLQLQDNAALHHDVVVDSTGAISVDDGQQSVLHGVLTGDGSDFAKTGGGALAIAADGNFHGVTHIDDGTLQLGAGGTSGAIGSGAFINHGTLAFNRADDFVFGNAIAGTGNVVKAGPGLTTLTGPLTYTGLTLLNQGELAIDGTTLGSMSSAAGVMAKLPPQHTLTLRNAELNGWMHVPDTLNVDASSRWNMFTGPDNPAYNPVYATTSHGTIISFAGEINLAGRINFMPPGTANGLSGGSVLVADNLNGQDGIVQLHVQSTETGFTDLIRLNGGAVGTTHLVLQMDESSVGDALTGDGAMVVQANGPTDNAFVQREETPGANRRGAFLYRLQHGSNVVNGVQVAPHNWYVRSEARPEVSLYSQLGNQAARHGELTVGTLNDRMGATESLARKVYPLVWARSLADLGRNHGSSAGLAAQDVATRSRLAGVQLGTDVYVNFQGLSRRSAGVFASASTMKTDVDHYLEVSKETVDAGRSEQTAYSLGGYYTLLDGKGSYLDLVTQVSRYDVKANSAAGAGQLTTTGWGGLISAEAGKSFVVGDDASNLRLEPQAQVIYQRIKFSGSQDDASAVEFPGVNSLTGRLGLRLSRTWDADSAKASTAWATVNLLTTAGHSSSRYATATQGDITFKNKLAGPRAGLTLGYDSLLGGNTFLNVQAGTEQGIGSRRSSNYNLNAGIKIIF
ncbi:autotransporter outer membrane beta-barrel domain-containing protein [Achromobacter sp. ACRQX]|uniref:autotransporter outer membrane beta-barrel domain-containing protein n=1 Tax=Achromobacter sp. ACRQX TaxID=2918181 RepID=UPI0021026EE5|nr:autotransporter outer membrane beta-barrel domain-containing protein [Achromobacter sp. ACRQX]